MVCARKGEGYVFLVLLFALASASNAKAEPGRVALPSHVPAVVAELTPRGRLPATNALHLAIGLPLRNQQELDTLLQELYDPTSPNFRRYLTPRGVHWQFGPTEQDYQAVMEFAKTNGLTVTVTHPNRVVLDVAGTVRTSRKPSA